MKKLSSVFYMWFGFGFGILATLMMFTPIVSVSRGQILSASDMFWGMGVYGGAWPAFIGYMLILLGSLGLALMALPFIQPSAKIEKIVLILIAISLLVGIFLIAFIYNEYSAMNGRYKGFDNFMPGYYLSIIFASIAIIATCIALKLDW